MGRQRALALVDTVPATRHWVVFHDLLTAERIPDVAILSGDLHSSWAFDVPRNPWAGYDRSGGGSIAVELVAPAISSPPLFSSPEMRDRSGNILERDIIVAEALPNLLRYGEDVEHPRFLSLLAHGHFDMPLKRIG